MCYINLRDEWDESLYEPGPRPAPRLTWALPVDVVELGVGLEAYSVQLPQITTLRLCHRFGVGPLCSLPQEILDQIISQAQQSMRDELRPKWTRNNLCFQGRCLRSHHFSAQDSYIDDLLEIMMDTEFERAGRYRKDLTACTEEEKLDLLREYLDDNEFDEYDEQVYDRHYERRNDWLDQICRCREKSTDAGVAPSFDQLYKVSTGVSQ